MTRYAYLLVVLILLGVVLSDKGFSQPSSSQNYVITNTVKQAGITHEGMVPGLPITTQGKSQSISYLDGLGRPLQTVMTQAGASKKDIITGVEYDEFGREVKKYLPYAELTNTANPGSYQPGWKTTQAGFYNGSLQGVDADAKPYSLSGLEASPLNRTLEQGAPGTAWQPTATLQDASAKTVKLYYEINTAADNVRIFNVDMSTGAVSSPGSYGAGLLTVKRSVDEHGGVTKEFTDKSGHMILKQVYTDNEVLSTYYIYDDLDLLRDVIQPQGVTTIPSSGSWSPDQTFTNNWMFVYTYDYRNRMITKQVPGASSVTMMYDQWDRLVLTQDGNQRTNNYWLFTKYDALNRPVVTGTITDTRSADAIQTELTASSGRYESVNTGAAEGYTLTNSFPSSGSYGSMLIYTTTHYDSYDNLPSWASGYSFVAENGVTPKNDFLQGQLVASQTRVLGTNNWMRTVTYYDDKYRVIQSTADNAAGGKDRVTRILSFDGKPLTEYSSHTSNVYSTALVTTKTYTYDHADRLLTVTHKIGTGETVTLVENAYNELGQLLNKKLHQSASHPQYLQKLDYSYNIRGWLNGINQPYGDGTGYDESDLFNFQLHYNTTNLQGATAQYNGNISEQVWKGGYDEYVRGYEYTYDKANRMVTSNYAFKYFNGYTQVWDFTMKYNEDITATGNDPSGYDQNGNIKHLERFHGSWQRIDNLQYDYLNSNTGVAGGNHLHKVTEGNWPENPNIGFHDYNNWFNDYNYDANGNLTNDWNKGINAISYNHLNLPTIVDFGGSKGQIEYLYDAAGNKLQKTVTDKTVSPNKISITKYAGAFVYTNSYLSSGTVPAETLEFIGHEEGRIRPAKIDTTQPLTATNTKYIYDYFMKDHLGNTRMVLTTEQQTDLYAATQEPANANKEDSLFNNLSSTTLTKPGGFDSDGANTKVSRVNGSSTSTRVGPSIILKVMAGDVISISTKAWYQGAPQSPVDLGPIKDQLLPLLTAGILANDGTRHGAIPLDDISSGGGEVLQDLLDHYQTYNSGRPKAFLNWMIVDEEFKKVTSSLHMGAVQVPAISGSMEKQQLTGPASMTVRRNGWLYVYVSNESNQDVYFDDLIVNHQRGPVVEQNNYYAFGMEIPGLHSQALGFGESPQNRKKFQGQEFTEDLGLSWDEFKYRKYDPQIGRFTQVDPLADEYTYNSTYDFSENKVTSHVEVEGLEASSLTYFWEEVKNELQGAANSFDRTLSSWTSFKSSTPNDSKTIGPVTVTNSTNVNISTETSTNLGGNLSYLMNNNTNKGNNEPATKTVTKVTTAAEQKVEVKINNKITVTNKTTIDNNGVITTENSAKVAKKSGIAIKGIISASSDGSQKAAVEISSGKNTSVKAILSGSTNGTSSNIDVGVGAETKTSKGTTTTSAGIRIRF